MTQDELSNLIHIDRNRIQQLETSFKAIPKEEELRAYCEYFNTTSDYLLGIRNTKPVDENIAMISKVTGLSNDAIEMLKLFNDKRKKYYPLHRRCIDMINLILSDFYKAIQKADDNNGIYFGNLFFSMWEYIHAKHTVTYKVNEYGEVEHKKNIHIVIDDDLDTACDEKLKDFTFSHSVSLEDATKSRAQREILKKLDKLEEYINKKK